MKTKSVAVTALVLTLIAGCQEQSALEDNAATVAPAETAATPVVPPPAGTVPRFTELDDVVLEVAQKAHCSIDRIGGASPASGAVTLSPGQTVVFSGWIAGPGNQVPAAFKVVLQGNVTLGVDATAGAGRPDVARVLKDESLANAGFNARADLGAIPEGEYNVSLVIPGETVARCDTLAKVVIAPAADGAPSAR